MAAPFLYLISVGLMAALAATPFALSGRLASLCVIAAGWAAGILLVPGRAASCVSDYPRTVAGVLGLCCVFALPAPQLAVLLLTTVLFFVRNRELFGWLLILSLLVLGHGLREVPSLLIGIVFFVSVVESAHLHVAKSLNPQAVLVAAVSLAWSLCAGAAVALVSPYGLSLPGWLLDFESEGGGPTPVSFIVGILLLFPLTYLLFKYLPYLGGRKGEKAALQAEQTVGEVVSEKEIGEAEKKTFSGPAPNEAVVREYVSWRKKLANLGFLFRRDQTCREGKGYLMSRMGEERALLERITGLFSAARYSRKELSRSETREFRKLTREAFKKAKQAASGGAGKTRESTGAGR